MLSSGLRKVMKALLILLAVAWITTDATATQLLRSRLLASIPNALSSGANRLLGERSAHKLRWVDRRGKDPAAWRRISRMATAGGPRASVRRDLADMNSRARRSCSAGCISTSKRPIMHPTDHADRTLRVLRILSLLYKLK